MSKRLKIACVVIMLCLCIFKMFNYYSINMLCNDIATGNDIDTTISNGTSFPVWLNSMMVVIDAEGPRIPLVEACYYRNSQAVEVLLSNGANPNFFIPGRKSPLEAALWNSPVDHKKEYSFEIVQMLIEAGADVNKHASEESVIIKLASSMVGGDDNQESEAILLYLLEHGAERISDGYEKVFHYMIMRGNVALIRTLVENYGFDVNGIGYKGQSPLILAITYSERSATVDMVQLLLEKGADVSIEDEEGKTAQDYAKELGYTHIVDILSDA